MHPVREILGGCTPGQLLEGSILAETHYQARMPGVRAFLKLLQGSELHWGALTQQLSSKFPRPTSPSHTSTESLDSPLAACLLSPRSNQVRPVIHSFTFSQAKYEGPHRHTMSLNQYLESKLTTDSLELAQRTNMFLSSREGDNHHGRQPHADWHPHLRRQPDQPSESEPNRSIRLRRASSQRVPTWLDLSSLT